VWDYAAPETVPTAENAKLIGTVEKNNRYTVPEEDFSACRLEVGTKLYRDNLYRGVIYCMPGPQGSDAEYGTMVLAHKIDQWWAQSPRKYGLYEHRELGYVDYIYLQKEQATLILSQELRLPVAIEEDRMTTYTWPTTHFRTDGNVLTLYTPGNDLEHIHYTYVGPQDITLRKSDIPPAGNYRLISVRTQTGQVWNTFTETGAGKSGSLQLNADGTGTLSYGEAESFVLWGSNGIYVAQSSQGYTQGTYDSHNKNLVIFYDGMLMSFKLSVEESSSSTGRLLTDEELKEFEALFQLPVTPENIWYNYGLKSAYEDPRDVDLLALFYSAPWQEPVLSPQEIQLLEEAGMSVGASAVHVYTEEMMDSVLRQYFGIGLEEATGVGLDEMVYNEELGCYYDMHGDYVCAYVELLHGRQAPDGSYELYYFHAYDEPNRIWAVRLVPTEGGYRFAFNMPVA